jgi:hypothetical protein
MAFVRIQGAVGLAGSGGVGASNTVVVTLGGAVGSGNAVCGGAAWDNSNSATVLHITDDKGNTYNLETEVVDTTNGEASIAFSLTNITNGPTVITLTLAASITATFMHICADEFSGGSTASSDERDGTAHGGQFLNTPGTGTDAATSGTFTTNVNGDLLYGYCMQAASVTPATHGTNFSDGTSSVTDFSTQSEYRTQATAGSGTAATFTLNVNVQSVVYLIAIKPFSGSSGIAVWPYKV